MDLRCSCGAFFASHLKLERHRERLAHCPDCGCALTTDADRLTGVCMACEHRRECPGCPASAHGFAGQHHAESAVR